MNILDVAKLANEVRELVVELEQNGELKQLEAAFLILEKEIVSPKVQALLAKLKALATPAAK